MSLLDRLSKRLDQAKDVAKDVAKTVAHELQQLRDRNTDPPRRPPARRPPPPPDPEPDLTDVVDTADRALLVGLTGLKLALEPHGKPMVVNHWATWCDGCVSELPLLVALRARWKGRADFIGVGWEGFSGGADPATLIRNVEAVAAEYDVDWATLVFEGDPDQLWTALELDNHQIPQTLVLHPDGRVMVHHKGELDDAAINRIEAALRQASIAG